MSSITLPVVTDTLEIYMSRVHKFPLLDKQQEYELARRYKLEGDLEAAHRLICSNLRFVVKVACEYRSYGMKLLDLVQEGNIGLMMAVRKFDPDRGIRLISYAVWWIRAYIQNYILKTWSLVKIGTTQAQKKLFYKLKQTKDTLMRLTGSADSAEIARELHLQDAEVDEMTQRLAQRDSSLDVELVEGESFNLLDTLADDRPNQEAVFLEMESHHLRAGRVAQALSTLNERETRIINDRILADSPRTLQELADDYGISRERVRQLEKTALEKLRKALPAPESE